jgi:hypothetical protein
MGSGVSTSVCSFYKLNGDDSFKRGDFHDAVTLYSRALDEYMAHIDSNSDVTESRDASVLFSNRSAAYYMLHLWGKSYDDAIRAIESQPRWAKGYFRAGQVKSKISIIIRIWLIFIVYIGGF